jgi:hypothetical protein
MLTICAYSFLLTHLYSFFGALLGCSQYGMAPFSAYDGDPSMYRVHKFMDLNPAQVGYFITQVALAGASFGVAQEDLMAIGTTLGNVFGVRCAPEVTLAPSFGSQLQSICIDESCPLSPNATCAAYGPSVAPKNVTSGTPVTPPGSSGTSTMMPSPTTSRPSSAGRAEAGLVAVAVAVFAVLLL